MPRLRLHSPRVSAPDPAPSPSAPPEGAPRPRAPVRRLLIGAAVLVALCALLWLTPLRQHLDPARLLAEAHSFRQSPAAPLVVVLAFGLLSSLMFPVNGLIALTGLAFGPWIGAAYALLAVLAAAVAQFAAGARLGGDAVARIGGARAMKLRGHLVRRGIWAVAATHVLPVAPFGLANLLAGASGIRFRDFMLGTALAMTPGVMIVAGLGGQLTRFF